MKTRIATNISSILDDIYDRLGYDAVWEGVNVKVRISARETHTEQRLVNIPSITVAVRVSEVTKSYPGDSVVIGDTSYIITGDPSGSSQEWIVDLVEVAA